MTQFPYKETCLLNNSVESETEVTLSGDLQVANITFTSAAGHLGDVQLSPDTSYMTNLKFEASRQILQIDKIEFRAAFGLTKGEVTAEGKASDQEGKDFQDFSKKIASWDEPS